MSGEQRIYHAVRWTPLNGFQTCRIAAPDALTALATAKGPILGRLFSRLQRLHAEDGTLL